MEQQILSTILSDRTAFELVKATKLNYTFSDIGKIVYKEVDKYYELDENAPKCSTEIIKERIESHYPATARKILEYIRPNGYISAENIREAVYSHGIKEYSTAIAEAGWDDNSKELEKRIGYLSEFKERFEKGGEGEYCTVRYYNTDEYWSSDPSDSSSADLIKILPVDLNKAIDGGLPPQTHVLIFAHTDVGKTGFAINMCYGFLVQGLKVGYVINEESGSNILNRYAARVLGKPTSEIRDNRHRYGKLLRDEFFADNFHVVDMEQGSLREISKFIEERELDVIVVDQVRNLDTGRSESLVAQKEIAGRGMRSLLKKYNIVGISVTQGADSCLNQDGSYKDILTVRNIDGSRVGLPGSADLILGLGTKDELKEVGYRTINLCKNKLSTQRGSITCKFDPVTFEVT